MSKAISLTWHEARTILRAQMSDAGYLIVVDGDLLNSKHYQINFHLDI